MRKFLPLVVVALFVGGCSLAPKLEVPEAPKLEENNVTINSDWYKEFKDEKLNALVEEALANNHDLLLAVSSVAQARAALGLAKAQSYPMISANAAASKTTVGENNHPSGKQTTTDSYSVSGVASYEVDLWGKFANAKKSALASLVAMELTKETVRLAIIAGVSESYFALVMLEENLEAVKSLQRAKQEGYNLRKKQYEVGAIGELLFMQIEADLYGTQAQLDQLTRQRDSAATALAVLVGRAPQDILDGTVERSENLPNVEIVASELPSDLIARRPDIQASESQLRAANYNIGSARAAYFPSISLTGMMGFQSNELGDLMKSGSATTQISGGVSVPIFDFGRIGANVESAKAGKESALIRYRQSLQKAFAEAYDAISRKDMAFERATSVTAQKTALERALELTRKKYEIGYVDYMAVIDAEGAFLNASMNENGAKFEKISSSINLFKALGGGWNQE